MVSLSINELRLTNGVYLPVMAGRRIVGRVRQVELSAAGDFLGNHSHVPGPAAAGFGVKRSVPCIQAYRQGNPAHPLYRFPHE